MISKSKNIIQPIYKNILKTSDDIYKLEIKLNKLKESSGVKKLEQKLEDKNKLLDSHKDYLKDQFVRNNQKYYQLIDTKSKQIFKFKLKSRNTYDVDLKKLKKENPKLIKKHTTFDTKGFRNTKHYQSYKIIKDTKYFGIEIEIIPLKKEK